MAILWQGLLAGGLCLTGTYEELFTYVTFAVLCFLWELSLLFLCFVGAGPHGKDLIGSGDIRLFRLYSD